MGSRLWGRLRMIGPRCGSQHVFEVIPPSHTSTILVMNGSVSRTQTRCSRVKYAYQYGEWKDMLAHRVQNLCQAAGSNLRWAAISPRDAVAVQSSCSMFRPRIQRVGAGLAWCRRQARVTGQRQMHGSTDQAARSMTCCVGSGCRRGLGAPMH
jgi:hypothetical protein